MKTFFNRAISSLSSVRALALQQSEVKQITLTFTDSGSDCDDQKAIEKAIGAMDPKREAIVFIVGGPAPLKAAIMIAQKYYEKNGRYPLISLAESKELNPHARMYSLVDGSEIKDKDDRVPNYVVSRESLNQEIERIVAQGRLEEFKMQVIAPIDNKFELYDPQATKNWQDVKKTAVLQFHLNDQNGKVEGFNASNSDKSVLEKFFPWLKKHGFETFFFQGAIAKTSDLKMAIDFDGTSNIGVRNAMIEYLLSRQARWLSFPRDPGHTPQAEEIHFIMFEEDAAFALISHASGKNPAGFGFKRFMNDVFGLSEADSKYSAIENNFAELMQNFDEAILSKLHKRGHEMDMKALKERLHAIMMTALKDAARDYGVVNIYSFKEFFQNELVKSKNISVVDFKEKFLAKISDNKLVQEVRIAVDEAKKEKLPNGKNFEENILALAKKHKAQAVVYDAVCVLAADIISKDEELKKFFANKNDSKKINIDLEKFHLLQKEQPELYDKLISATRAALQQDGSKMAYPAKTTKQNTGRSLVINQQSPTL